MSPLGFVSRSVFLTVVASVCLATVPRLSAAPGPDSCDKAPLPAQVREMLRNKFAGWRPKQLSDLGADDQKVWLQGPSGKSCPGIAIGHFQSATELSYAFLLLRESGPAHGYQIVIFSKQADGDTYTSNLLDHSDAEPDSSLVISKADPGKFSDLESEKSVRTKLDSVIVEWLEKGAVLYYWTADRYRRIVISD
jgi:hypothetical protein